MRGGRRFALGLAAVCGAGLAARIAYLVLQSAHDPAFARPMLDGAYYLAWARALGAADPAFSGAYHLGPLYPWLVRLTGLGGEGARYALLALQHAAIVAAAATLGVVARRSAGSDLAGWAAAALVLLYHPATFFASRPLSEPLGILLLALAVWAGERPAASGFLAGLAALARPSFLPIPALWSLYALLSRRWRAAAWLAAGAAVAIAPATIRNYAVSGHLVPVSANSGIVAWLGNGPGAIGVYTPSEGFSGALATQREEARALASSRSGRALDAVEADRYWMREAIRERLAHPAGTIALVARRVALTLDDAEHGLDYAPSLDANPARWLAPVPFAVVLGLACAGVVLRGWRGTGGAPLWVAVLGCALAPVLFYVSSRHRLPLAILLAVPAGVAVDAFAAAGGASRRRLALAAALVAAAASWLVPSGEIVRSSEASALSNLAVAAKDAGDLDGAERMLRRALERDPGSLAAAFNLGVVLERRGRAAEAEASYRRVVASDPGHAEAAGNLAGILVRRGVPAEAVPILRRALVSRPGHAPCWTNLVVALLASGDARGAREAAERAQAAGVALDPGLRRAAGLSP